MTDDEAYEMLMNELDEEKQRELIDKLAVDQQKRLIERALNEVDMLLGRWEN